MRSEDGKPEVLLVKDSYGRWTWPKGKLEKGETPEQAALREIREETGLGNTEIICRLGETKYFYRLKGKLIFKTVYVFLLRCTGNESLKIQREEIQDAAWLPVKQALQKLEYRGAAAFLRKAVKKFRDGE